MIPPKWTIHENFKDCICALDEQICTVKTSDRSQMNPNIFLNNTVISVQLPYIAGHSLYSVDNYNIFSISRLVIVPSQGLKEALIRG